MKFFNYKNLVEKLNIKISNINIYLNSKYNLLNIYYERFLRDKSLKLLGITYKNSKWLNYLIENIKLNFINLFVYLIIIIFILVSLIIFIFGKDDIEILSTSFSVKGIVLNIWYKLYLNLWNLQYQTYLIIPLIYLFIFDLISNYLNINILKFYKKINKVKNISNKQNKNIKDLNLLLYFKKLYILNNLFNYTRSYLMIKKDIILKINIKNNKSFMKKNYKLKDIEFFKYNLNSNKIYTITNLNMNNLYNKSLINYNIQNIINLLKEDRWYIKNDMIDNNLINIIYKNTNIKNILNLNILDYNIIFKNIWYSTKNQNINITKIKNYINLYYKNLNKDLWSFNNNNNLLEFYDFYENSLYWLNKKYYYLNKYNINTIILWKPIILNIFEKKNINYYLYNILFILKINIFNLSLNTNINNKFFKNINFFILNKNNDYIKELNLKVIISLLNSNLITYNNYLLNNFKIKKKNIFFIN